MVGLDTSLNTAVGIILFICCIINGRKDLLSVIQQNKTFVKAVFLFIGLILICIPFGEVSGSKQLSSFLQTIITEFIPSFCFLIAIRDKDSLRHIIYTVCVCCIISGIYGLYAFYVKGNPYFLYMMTHYGSIETLRYSYGEMTKIKGGLVGFAAGMATGDALKWSQIVLLCIMFLLCIRKTINRNVFIATTFLLFLNCLLTVQRSAFLALLAGILYISQKTNSWKRIFMAFIMIFFFFIVLELTPRFQPLKQHIYSTIFIWDDQYAHSQNIGGSSFALRTKQMEETLNSLSEDPLFGKGYSYSGLYHEKYGDGYMKGFESIFFKVGWENGIIGLFAWSILLLGCYRYVLKQKSNNTIYYKAFFYSYFFTILLTGIQTTLFLFLIFTILCKKHTETNIQQTIT